MLSAVGEVCGVYGLTVVERKTKAILMHPPHHEQEGPDIVAAGQRYAQIEQLYTWMEPSRRRPT